MINYNNYESYDVYSPYLAYNIIDYHDGNTYLERIHNTPFDGPISEEIIQDLESKVGKNKVKVIYTDLDFIIFLKATNDIIFNSEGCIVFIKASDSKLLLQSEPPDRKDFEWDELKKVIEDIRFNFKISRYERDIDYIYTLNREEKLL